MKFHVYAIRDELTGFLAPTLDSSDPVACRSFRAALAASPVMVKNPADFSLYRIGVYDSDSGLLTPTVPPEFVMRGDIDA